MLRGGEGHRRVVADGLVTVRRRNLVALRHPALSPPRLRLEEAVRDNVARGADPEAVINLVLRVSQRRLTTADRRYGLVVELDGTEAHPDDERFRDRHRDNRLTLGEDAALRYGWREVALDACGIAVQVVVMLWRGGWTGTPRPCGPGCQVAALLASDGGSPTASGG